MKVTEVKVDTYKWDIPDLPWIGNIPVLKEPGEGYIVRMLIDEGIKGNCTILGAVIRVQESIARLWDLAVTSLSKIVVTFRAYRDPSLSSWY